MTKKDIIFNKNLRNNNNYKSSEKQKFDEILAFSKKQFSSTFLNSFLMFNYTKKKYK